MQVQPLDDTPSHAAAWDAFVARHPDATSDHWWGWRQVLSGAFGFDPYYLAATDGQEIVGILPLFLIPRGFGQWAFSSIPYGNYGGVCALTDEAARSLLNAAKALADARGARYVDLRHRTPVSDPTLQPQTLYSRFTLPLCGDVQRHAQELGQNSRKKISRARRSGLRVVPSRDVRSLYAIHLRTTKHLGTPCFPRRYFELILEAFGERAVIYFAAMGSTMVAYDVAFRFKESLVIQLGGALESSLRYLPNHLLFWHFLEEGCARGLRELDYCRNRSDSGAAQFKRSLHLRETPLAYQYYLPDGHALPQRHPSNHRYQLVIQAWKRLPLRLTQWWGPALVRYLA